MAAGLLFERDIDAKERIFGFLRSGLSIIPLCWPDGDGHCCCPAGHHNPEDVGKAPPYHPEDRWSWARYKTHRPTEEEVWSWIARFGYGCNWGIIGGEVSGLVILDFDSWEGLEWFEQHVEPLRGRTLVIVSGSGRGVHAYLRWRPGAKSMDLKDGGRKICEVRGGGSGGRYVVAPWSMHRCGQPYVPLDGYAGEFGDVFAGQILVERLLPLPDHDLLTGSGPSAPTSGVTVSTRGSSTDHNSSAPFSAGLILREPELAAKTATDENRDPTRSALLSRVVWSLRGAGWSKERIFAECCKYPWTLCDKPKAELLRQIERTCVKADQMFAKRRASEQHGEGESGEEGSEIRVLMDWAADVEEEPTTYLWESMLPQQMVASLYGDQAEGKTFVAMDLAARITRGDEWPDGRGRFPQGNVLYLNAEDDRQRTLRPRAAVAGADLSRIAFPYGVSIPGIGLQTPSLKDHLEVLRRMIADTEPRLVIFDPIQAYLGADVDMFRANETRPLITPLIRICEEFGCTILFLGHLTKSSRDRALGRALGSVDLTASMRSVVLAGHMPNDPMQHGLVHIKCSVGPTAKPIGYRIENVVRTIKGIDVNVGRLSWNIGAAISAADLLSPDASSAGGGGGGGGGDGDGGKMMVLARLYLKQSLTDTTRPATEIIDGAENLSISESTLRRAAKMLGVVHSKDAGTPGTWHWSLPAQAGDEAGA